MQPTDILMDEHRVIEIMLSCLEKMAQSTRDEQRLNVEDARDTLEFFRHFADGCHHAKEEDRLFPAMEQRGVPREGGPLGVMVYEHELGRQYIRAMSDAVDSYSDGRSDALPHFRDNANAYIRMLREHIEKEDHCLFAMANNVLSEADQADLIQRFEQFEEEETGRGGHEKYLHTAQRLAEQYGVDVNRDVLQRLLQHH